MIVNDLDVVFLDGGYLSTISWTDDRQQLNWMSRQTVSCTGERGVWGKARDKNRGRMRGREGRWTR